jgi:hypothetical protein
MYDDLGDNVMDVEVWHSIAKYFFKLERLIVQTYDTISTGMTEEMMTIIAKNQPQLKRL